ncbi:MAG: dihydrofolate reductase [Muribaculaceae bacterium]|nr:dihydrofolate reductase [Muribaculaceae bacterium]
MDLNLIVAIGDNGEIGKDGDLIWKIPADLKRFKTLTTGHPVIMGRKTWDSLPKRPLPGRRNIILTRNPNFHPEGAETVNSIEEALKLTNGENPFVIGGKEIYKAFLPFITRAYITRIFDKCEEADSFLSLDFSKDWDKTEESPVETTPDGINYQYVTYQRIKI